MKFYDLSHEVLLLLNGGSNKARDILSHKCNGAEKGLRTKWGSPIRPGIFCHMSAMVREGSKDQMSLVGHHYFEK